MQRRKIPLPFLPRPFERDIISAAAVVAAVKRDETGEPNEKKTMEGKRRENIKGEGESHFQPRGLSEEEVIGALLAHSPMYFSLPPTLQKPQPRPYDWNWSVGKVPKVEEEGGTSNRLIVLLGRREGAIQRNGRWRGGRSDVALLKRDGGWSSGLGRAKKGRERRKGKSLQLSQHFYRYRYV